MMREIICLFGGFVAGAFVVLLRWARANRRMGELIDETRKVIADAKENDGKELVAQGANETIEVRALGGAE